jgi:tetratricopeptide (TPR) repeat protein
VIRESNTSSIILLAAGLLFASGCASSSQQTDEASGEAEAVEASADQGEADEEAEAKQADQKTDAEAEQGTADAQGDTKGATRPPKGTKKPETKGDPAFSPVANGVNAANEGNYTVATRRFERALDSDQGFLAAYNLGVVAETQGNLNDAASHYRSALNKDGTFTPALTNLVRLHLRQGDVSKAESLARQYAENHPDNMSHRAVQLEVMLAKEQYNDVVQQSKSILKRDERNVEAMVALATANYRMGRNELAKAVLNRASDLSPERPDIYFLFGLIAMDNDETSKAIANFKEALKYAPHFPEAHNNLGLLYDEASDYQSAANQFQAAIDAYPDFAAAHLNLGNAYKNLSKPKEAESSFQQVLEIDEDYADAYFNLGILYLDADMPGMEKIPRLEKAIEMLNEYKRVSRGQLSEDDPADKYIQAARKQIDAEKQRQKMMRQMQKKKSGGDSSGGDSSGDSSDSSDDSKSDSSSSNGTQNDSSQE